MQQFVKVKLLGELGRLFGREWELLVGTPAEAIRAIACQCPDFLPYLHSSEEQGIVWRVVASDLQGCTEGMLTMPIGTSRLVFAPIVAGRGSVGRILLGVALIGAAFLVPGGFLGLTPFAIGLVGGSLVAGGIAQILSPTPKKPKKQEDSALFDRNADVIDQGGCVPVLYGERIIAGMPVLSASMEVLRAAV